MEASPATEILWSPTDPAASRLADYARWLEARVGTRFTDYGELHRWSTRDLDGFWMSIWDYFDFGGPRPEHAVESLEMPGTSWFPGARVNYAREMLSRAADECLVTIDERHVVTPVSKAELTAQVGALAGTLRDLGVDVGDRVAGYVSNSVEGVVALLATTAIGAVWTSCAPEFGAQGAIDRMSQLEPKVLIGVNGYGYGGRFFDRADDLNELRAALPSLEATIVVARPGGGTVDGLAWDTVMKNRRELEFADVPFEHPLWVLFSSGTTGRPKGIIHSHGGIALEHAKSLALASDLGPGDRIFVYCSTSWMVWNWMLGAMLVGATPVLYEGSPTFPDVAGSWRVAAAAGAACFGAGAQYVAASQAAELHPWQDLGLDRLRTVISTGSPLPLAAWDWFYGEAPASVRLDSSTGGTDVCGSFIASSPWLPVFRGELSGPCLGVAVESLDENGRSLINERGELVIAAPMPSMPIGFWNDPDGSRYREAYFDRYPGKWRHGDWISVSSRGGIRVLGRSDATLNRGGVRFGSADIYNAVSSVEGLRESLVVGVELPDGGYFMPLFLAVHEGADGNVVRSAAAEAIASTLTRRHMPDAIVVVPDIPQTRTGKRIEVPVKRILQGVAASEAVSLASVANAEILLWFEDYGRTDVVPRIEAATTRGRVPSSRGVAYSTSGERRADDPQGARPQDD